MIWSVTSQALLTNSKDPRMFSVPFIFHANLKFCGHDGTEKDSLQGSFQIEFTSFSLAEYTYTN